MNWKTWTAYTLDAYLQRPLETGNNHNNNNNMYIDNLRDSHVTVKWNHHQREQDEGFRTNVYTFKGME